MSPHIQQVALILQSVLVGLPDPARFAQECHGVKMDLHIAGCVPTGCQMPEDPPKSNLASSLGWGSPQNTLLQTRLCSPRCVPVLACDPAGENLSDELEAIVHGAAHEQ